MKYKVEDRVIDIVLKEFKNKGFTANILYVDFLNHITHQGININGEYLLHILYIARAYELVKITNATEGGIYITIDKKGTFVLQKHNDYLEFLKNEEKKQTFFYVDNYSNLKWILGIVFGFISGFTVSYFTHRF